MSFRGRRVLACATIVVGTLGVSAVPIPMRSAKNLSILIPRKVRVLNAEIHNLTSYDLNLAGTAQHLARRRVGGGPLWEIHRLLYDPSSLPGIVHVPAQTYLRMSLGRSGQWSRQPSYEYSSDRLDLGLNVPHSFSLEASILQPVGLAGEAAYIPGSSIAHPVRLELYAAASPLPYPKEHGPLTHDGLLKVIFETLERGVKPSRILGAWDIPGHYEDSSVFEYFLQNGALQKIAWVDAIHTESLFVRIRSHSIPELFPR